VKRLTLSGYYGYGNAGDEAVLAGLVAGFQAAPGAEERELVALSGHPAETRAAHGIGAVDRYKPSALLREIGRTDLFLSGGGSLLQDVTSAHGIFYYLGVVRMAQVLGKKTMFIAQGIGPLRSGRSRRLVKSVANRLNAITVRDEASAQLLRQIGVAKPFLEVTADPALLLNPHEAAATAGTFGVALRPWHGQEGVAAHVADACAAVLAGRRALLIPMQPATDKPIAEQFMQKWHQGNRATLCSPERGLPPLLVNIASCELMIGMRLHALILAAAACIPSLALSYDPKVDAFMQGSGQGDAVYDLTQSDPDALAGHLGRVWATRAERAAALQTALPALRDQAARNVAVALNLL
jgi:polysaccharide pyruvyl transferase CsaB